MLNLKQEEMFEAVKRYVAGSGFTFKTISVRPYGNGVFVTLLCKVEATRAEQGFAALVQGDLAPNYPGYSFKVLAEKEVPSPSGFAGFAESVGSDDEMMGLIEFMYE